MSIQDDFPLGRIITRREALTLLGSGMGLAMYEHWRSQLAAAESLSCIVRPQQTEGPYFVDEELDRGDIRSDPKTGAVCDGVPLELKIRLNRLSGLSCRPLAGAIVDVWHCDARGFYSDEKDEDFDTLGQKFLRGYRVSDPDGLVQFTTIYPGWYIGRTPHIHIKVRSHTPEKSRGSDFEFTSQMYFEDELTDQVYLRSPYNKRGPRKYRNADDGLFLDGGANLMLKVVPSGSGYHASIDYALADGS